MLLDVFRVGVLLLGLFRACFSRAGLGVFFAYSVLPTPPLSVGAGVGNRATHLWHRTRFRSCGLGFRWFLAYSVLFYFRPTDPPPARELGAIWITMPTPTVKQDRPVCVNISLSRRHFLALPTLRVAWRWLSLMIFSCPLRPRLPFFLFLDVPCRLRYLAAQRCGSGLGGAASSTHGLARGIGVSTNFL